jgi:tryptophan synthase alpha chain
VSPITSSDNTGVAHDALAPCFEALRAKDRRALIPYVTAGYPSPAATLDALDHLVRGGADIIELGVPFSDPVADGPTIQRASQRAIEQGVTLAWTLQTLHEFRRRHATPVVLFTYLNPILRYGAESFIADAAEAGAQGVLVTDLPVGADPVLEQRLETSPLALVRLIAPTTRKDRALVIAARAQGFLYYISRMGVTGATRQLRDTLAAEVAALRAVCSAPIAVGFGISTPEQAGDVARVADGVVVGSALIDALDRGGLPGMQQFLASLRAGMDAATASALT